MLTWIKRDARIEADMETVIAAYHDLSAAERAVRSLEQRGISIQNISIVDELHRIWRRSYPAWARPSIAKNARRAFLIGVAVSFVVAQLALHTPMLTANEPLPARLIWAVTLATCAVSGSLSAFLSMKFSRPARRSPRFSVILRSDAATLAAVAAFFPRARKPEGDFPRRAERVGR